VSSGTQPHTRGVSPSLSLLPSDTACGHVLCSARAPATTTLTVRPNRPLVLEDLPAVDEARVRAHFGAERGNRALGVGDGRRLAALELHLEQGGRAAARGGLDLDLHRGGCGADAERVGARLRVRARGESLEARVRVRVWCWCALAGWLAVVRRLVSSSWSEEEVLWRGRDGDGERVCVASVGVGRAEEETNCSKRRRRRRRIGDRLAPSPQNDESALALSLPRTHAPTFDGGGARPSAQTHTHL
jgi:hypothetical protein